MTVIDLGELRHDAPPGPAPRPPRAVGRPFRLLVVLLVALLTLTAAGPPRGPAEWTLPGGLGSAVFVAGDVVYVVRPGGSPGDGRKIVAYRGERELWRSPLPGAGTAVSVWQQEGRVMVAGPAGNDEDWETVTYDAATGAEVWRRRGVAFAIGRVLLSQSAASDPRPSITRVDPTDGHTMWTVPMTGMLGFDYGSGVERMVLSPVTGQTVVVDARTGSRLAARDLHPVQPPAQRQVLTVGGLLLEIRDAGRTVEAYDLDTLRPRWTVEQKLVDYVDSCGALLCAAPPAGGMTALDPATGAARWTVDRWAGVAAARGDRLLVGDTATGTGGLAVLGQADGHLVAELDGWTLVPQHESGGPLLATRPLGGGRQLLAEMDLSGGPPPIRGVITGTDCTTGVTLLVCRRPGGDYMVRRLP
ncbi:PQQ-binding-like beta-propeller repeat protein [Micromonospora sp. C32]|uniref:outer membrane protein assembly factor BamB family protein n=1 Tax=unclassified Micromonospora TaxID=2617518 RepID=UPI001B36AA27|nr:MULTISPECIES: PQQ-binding-like beta-propeller repeat protein [unclassified Micromonospora]MBQ1042145.1 PQQ-binding-like beta-propeller repeat protein [Micromonospora sp. C72]MBQ1056319.1 PQQ-binding-like beta-propeller repeat protein [Micromonospora sp. C32]